MSSVVWTVLGSRIPPSFGYVFYLLLKSTTSRKFFYVGSFLCLLLSIPCSTSWLPPSDRLDSHLGLSFPSGTFCFLELHKLLLLEPVLYYLLFLPSPLHFSLRLGLIPSLLQTYNINSHYLRRPPLSYTSDLVEKLVSPITHLFLDIRRFVFCWYSTRSHRRCFNWVQSILMHFFLMSVRILF